MTQFSSGFFVFLVYGALALAALGALMLLSLLVRDFVKKRIW